MGSKTFDGVWFISYAHDHPPPHVHGYYAETAVVIDLLTDATIRQSERTDAVEPKNAKRSDVKRILGVASEHTQALWDIWEKMHGPASK